MVMMYIKDMERNGTNGTGIKVGDGLVGTDRSGLWLCGAVVLLQDGRVYVEDTSRTVGNQVEIFDFKREGE